MPRKMTTGKPPAGRFASKSVLVRGAILSGLLLIFSIAARAVVPHLTGRPVRTSLVLDLVWPILMGFMIVSASDWGARLRSNHQRDSDSSRPTNTARSEGD